MEEKDKIRNAPFLLHVKTYRHYDVLRTNLFIEIDITNKKEKLVLFSKGMYLGKHGKHFHNYDDEGRKFFNELMPNFGKIKIKHNEKLDLFDNYDDFLDEIT